MTDELTPHTSMYSQNRTLEGSFQNFEFHYHHDISFDLIWPQYHYYLPGYDYEEEEKDVVNQQPIHLFEPIWTLSWATDLDQRFWDFGSYQQSSCLSKHEDQPDEKLISFLDIIGPSELQQPWQQQQVDDSSSLRKPITCPEIKTEQDIIVKQEELVSHSDEIGNVRMNELNIHDLIILTASGRVTRGRLNEFLSTSYQKKDSVDSFRLQKQVGNGGNRAKRSKHARRPLMQELDDSEQNMRSLPPPEIKIETVNQKGSKKGLYKCGHCREGFRRLSSFQAHVQEVGAPRPYKCTFKTCPWCVIGFLNKNECNRHMKHQHSNARFQCQLRQCRKVFVRLESKNRHERLVHGRKRS